MLTLTFVCYALTYLLFYFYFLYTLSQLSTTLCNIVSCCISYISTPCITLITILLYHYLFIIFMLHLFLSNHHLVHVMFLIHFVHILSLYSTTLHVNTLILYISHCINIVLFFSFFSSYLLVFHFTL